MESIHQCCTKAIENKKKINKTGTLQTELGDLIQSYWYYYDDQLIEFLKKNKIKLQNLSDYLQFIRFKRVVENISKSEDTKMGIELSKALKLYCDIKEGNYNSKVAAFIMLFDETFHDYGDYIDIDVLMDFITVHEGYHRDTLKSRMRALRGAGRIVEEENNLIRICKDNFFEY